jgi:septal ring factor EnvC (AmiA/AmiB activator)
MFKREDVEKQISFLEKDIKSVQERIEVVRSEDKQLVATLASLNGAVQVSNHYLSMFDDDKGKKAATQKTKKNVEGEQPTKTEVLADDMHAV